MNLPAIAKLYKRRIAMASRMTLNDQLVASVASTPRIPLPWGRNEPLKGLWFIYLNRNYSINGYMTPNFRVHLVPKVEGLESTLDKLQMRPD